MRNIIVVFFLVLSFFVAQPAHAIYPFGGRLVAAYHIDDGVCNDNVIVVVGPHGGVFAIEAYTQWVVGLPIPLRWTLGIATGPSFGLNCPGVIIGGSSLTISLQPQPNQLSFAYHSSTPQWH